MRQTTDDGFAVGAEVGAHDHAVFVRVRPNDMYPVAIITQAADKTDIAGDAMVALLDLGEALALADELARQCYEAMKTRTRRSEHD